MHLSTWSFLLLFFFFFNFSQPSVTWRFLTTLFVFMHSDESLITIVTRLQKNITDVKIEVSVVQQNAVSILTPNWCQTTQTRVAVYEIPFSFKRLSPLFRIPWDYSISNIESMYVDRTIKMLFCNLFFFYHYLSSKCNPSIIERSASPHASMRFILFLNISLSIYIIPQQQ